MTALTTQDEASARRAHLRALAAELIARDSWSRERLHQHRRGRLDALLRHAVSRSPYYRDVLGPDAARGAAALVELPILTKATLMDEFDRIVTDPRITRDGVETHLAAAEPGATILDEYLAFSTAGTTGERAVLVYSQEEFATWTAAALRMLTRAGVTPETRLVAIGAPSPLHITRQLFAAFSEGRPGTPRLSVTTPIDDIVRALNEYRPEAIVTYASIASLLAEEQLDGRLRIEPSIVAVGSEVLTEEIEQKILDAWGTEPVNVYASTEALVIASSSPLGGGLCVCDDLAIVEVVDEDDQLVPPGVLGNRVLLTNLVNRTIPLIRYELSDSVVLADGDEPVSLPYQLIAFVGGRTGDILSLPAIGGGEVAVHPYRLHAPVGLFADVRQYQIVWDENRLLIRVVLRPSAAEDVMVRVGAAIVHALEDAGAVAPPVHVERVAEIAREPGHAAKLKLMIHR